MNYIKPLLAIGLTLFILGSQSSCQSGSQTKHSDHKTKSKHNHSEHDGMDMSNLNADDGMDMSELNVDKIKASVAPIESSEAAIKTKQPKTPSKKTVYRGPMHPWITSDKPGKCPICHMDLEPVEVDGEEHTKTPLPQGLSRIKISSRKQQLIGVKTGLIEKRPLKHSIRTVGKVDFNEKAISHVHIKYDGWLENVFVDFKGKSVKKGQALFRIYSPGLVSAQKEYLNALSISRQFQNPDLVSSQEMSKSLLQVAQDKLRLWDMSWVQIKALARTGRVNKHITIYSPASGVVVATTAVQGMRVSAGTHLYKIANLSSVWVTAQIYEYEIPQVKVGQSVNISLPYLPGKSFSGKINYIDPYLDSKSRTAKVRINLPNYGKQFKPDMFADLEIIAGSQRSELSIPVSAVMDSGKRKIIYLAQDNGYFEPREVTLGARMGSYYILKTGPVKGTKVVIDANFLIDAESQLNAAVNGMSEGHQH